MKLSKYKSYDELPLFLNAALVAEVLGIAPSSAYELELTVPIETRLTAALFGAFCPLSLGGRQPACASQDKNPSKIARCEVPCSFDGAVFRQGKKGAAENTCCILKAPDAALAENCPSKPGFYRHRQLMHEKEFPMLKVGSRMVAPKERFIEWVERNAGGGCECGTD